jgi:hypothetical protein
MNWRIAIHTYEEVKMAETKSGYPAKQEKSIPSKGAVATCYLAVFLIGLAFWRTPIHDPDLGFHLLGGRWVDQTGDVPRADFINALNPTWIDYHWFGQWLIYLVYKFTGYPGTQAVCGIIGAFLGLTMLAITRNSARNVPLELSVSYVACIQWLTFGLISTRPTSMAIVIVAFALLLLLKYRDKSILILFLLTCLCANIHIYWVLISLLWGLHFCLPRLLPFRQSRKLQISSLKSWGGLVALIFAGSISPYGIFNTEPGLNAKFANYYVLADVAINPTTIKGFVAELQPGLSQWGNFAWFTLLLIVLVFKSYSLPRMRTKSFELALFLGSFLMLTEARKYAIFFSIFSIPLVIPVLVRIASRASQNHWLQRQVFFKPSLLPFILLVYGFWTAYSTSPFLQTNADAAVKELEEMVPIKVCAEIPKMFPAPLRTILITSPYDYGGWCAWGLNLNQSKLPGKYRLTFDGRTQFVPVQRIIDGFKLYSLGTDWQKTLESNNPDVILAGRQHALGQLLNYLPGWKLAYAKEAENFGLFVREQYIIGESKK